MTQRNLHLLYFIKLVLFFLFIFPQHSSAGIKSDREKVYLEALDKAHDQKSKVDILIKLSVLFYDFDAKKNLMYTDSAINISERIGYNSALGHAYSIKGDTYNRLGYLNMANEYCTKALEVLESPRDNHLIAGIYTLLGNINLSRSNISKATYYYQLSYDIHTELNHTRGAVQALLNLGVIHLGNGENDTSKSLFEKAIRLSDQINYLNGQAIGYQNLGSTYSSMNKIDSSNMYYRIAQDLFIKDGDKGGYSASFLGLSENAMKTNNYNLAIKYATTAYDSIVKYGNTFIAIDAAKMLIGYYDYLGDSISTIKYHRAIAKHSQKVLSTERTNNIDYIEILNKENENKTLRKERNNQNNLNTTLLISLILLLGIITLLYINRKRDKKYKEQLLLNAHVLEQLNIEVEEKNQGLNHLLTIKDKLLSLIAHDVRSPLNNVREIISLLRDDTLSKEQFNVYVANLEAQTNTTAEMVDNLLNWARFQMNGIRLKEETIFVSSHIDEVLVLFNNIISNKKLSIAISSPLDHTIYSDLEALKIILRNIISNALKFSVPNSTIYITTEKQNGLVKICITDSGKGNVQEILNILSKDDEFRSTPGTMNEKGSGIGLKLVKEFVEFLGGTIGVSTAETGITFCITLPEKRIH